MEQRDINSERPMLDSFDQLVINKLGHYVYALFDSITDQPFYIGKGKGNRVFEHLHCALKEETSTLKLDKIREIDKNGQQVGHMILRHGLTEKEAFEVEASLIDFGRYLKFDLSNINSGHYSLSKGLMNTREIIRLHNAIPLIKLDHRVIIININKNYLRGNSHDKIYTATKEAWVVAEDKRKSIEYALSEYCGIIVGVYKINDWYPLQTSIHKRNNRWGFNGTPASSEIESLYLNKSIAHVKKKGAANPIRYRL